ncbi:thiol:disulfide interchange protein DsbA/DsbL [Halioxenophilus sp. WMMB6]|uniref:thiol:disulfide interchange protein DsbA/DsbL n=1 Tax=Halioxenophilus sp. WMMB6 TaxID=3073815 RepID=UPI00295F349C|nr:thiol:disulfide interchange protein DsbA/DsbL [Halioxenophilus sp. WMMB6]
MRYMLATFSLVATLAVATVAFMVMESPSANAEEAYQAGVHYQVLSQPVPTSDPNKIEVTEVFWYGCGHCFHFEPMLQQWKKTLPDDVVFVQSPAIWNAPMEVHAKAFYTAKALGKLEEMHQPLFNALNLEKKRLTDEKSLAVFFSDFGVDEATFEKTFRSFGVVSQVNIANSRARGYGVEGTPELVVNGQYRVSARLAGSQENMLKVAQFLVDKIRAEHSAAAAMATKTSS